MKSFVSSALVLFALSTSALGDAAGDERALKELVKDMQAAVVNENIPFLETILHKDYIHTRPNGTVYDRAKFLESVKKQKLDYDKLTISDVKVQLYGDTAILSGRSDLEVVKDKKEKLKGETRWTRVFLRQDGKWKLVAFQATLVEK